MKITTPYADEVCPLSSESFEALKADINANGQQVPVFIDEHGAILDGHHRFKILGQKVETRVVAGLSDAQKLAFCHRYANNRRNLSPDQRNELRKRQKQIAEQLRTEDPKRWTQARVAAELGVSQPTVAAWLTTNISTDKGCKPDARVKLSAEAKRHAAEEVASGKSQTQVAADLGVTPQAISKIVAAVAQAEEEAARDAQLVEAARKATIGHGVLVGDFVDVASKVADGAVDLIFTDPPYHRRYLHYYMDLANIAVRVLRDGGSLMCYCGQYLLPEIMAFMHNDGLRFHWCCAVTHSGQLARMNEYGVVVGWKPILWFTKGRRDHTSFVDDVVSGGREKGSHPWQQAVDEAAYYIERLSSPGGLVFDPFCGGGTTAVACKRLGRKWLTCDVEERHVGETLRRLEAE